MGRYPSLRFGRAALLAALAAIAAPASAQGSRLHVSRWRPVAPKAKLPGGCPGLYQGQPKPGFRFEPIAVSDPRRSADVSLAWIQGSGQGILTATSRDGGRHWRPSSVPQTSSCAGGTRNGAADPWLSYGPHGNLYLTAIPGDLLTAPLLFASEVLAFRSHDGGRTWSAPSTVAPTFLFNDKDSVTADPAHPRTVYATYSKRTGLSGENGSLFFRSSTNAARTWSAERTVYLAPPLTVAANGQVLALPDGTLVDVFDMINESEQLPIPRVPWQVMASVSTDGGSTWSTPATIATLPSFGSRSFAGDGAGGKILAAAISSTSRSRSGRIYAAWASDNSDTSSQIKLATSRNGRAWRVRDITSAHALAVQPTVATARDGMVGVTWFELQPPGTAGGPLPAKLRFAYSRNHGKTWHRQTIRRFDYRRAPRTGEAGQPGAPLFLGDYYGLAPLRKGFLAAVTLPSRTATRTAGDSELYSARLVVRRRAQSR